MKDGLYLFRCRKFDRTPEVVARGVAKMILEIVGASEEVADGEGKPMVFAVEWDFPWVVDVLDSRRWGNS